MRVKPTLWLHVGLPKTATTAFQSWMRSNTDDLAEQGVLYPALFGSGGDKHNFIVSWLRNNRNFKRLGKILGASKGDAVLLSNEGLSNHFDDFDGDALSKFREVTQGWDVQIILVTRDAESWVRSYHKQCVLNPNNGGSPLWGTSMTVDEMAKHPRVRRFLENDTFAHDLKCAFGASQVHRFKYEDIDWFQACLSKMGVSMSMAVILPQSNQSLPDWAIEVLRHVNSVTDDMSIRNGWKLSLQNHLSSNHTILTNLSKAGEVPINQNRLLNISFNIDEFEEGFRPAVTRFLDTLCGK